MTSASTAGIHWTGFLILAAVSSWQRPQSCFETRRVQAVLARRRCVSAHRSIATPFFFCPLVPTGVELTCNQFQAMTAGNAPSHSWRAHLSAQKQLKRWDVNACPLTPPSPSRWVMVLSQLLRNTRFLFLGWTLAASAEPEIGSDTAAEGPEMFRRRQEPSLVQEPHLRSCTGTRRTITKTPNPPPRPHPPYKPCQP